MSAVFVGLVFGMCAGIVDYAPQDTLLVGYKSADKCIPVFALTGDSYADQDVVSEGHTIHWRWLEGGCEVQIDDQWFVVMKFMGG